MLHTPQSLFYKYIYNMILFVNTSKREHEIKKKVPPERSGRALEQIMKKTYCLLG